MKLKTLMDQHDHFATMRAKKAECVARKEDKARQWQITKEAQRKRREQRDRKSDLFQQRRLADDPEYHSMTQ